MVDESRGAVEEPDPLESLRDSFDRATEALAGYAAHAERLVTGRGGVLRNIEQRIAPAWRRVTAGERRWPVSLVVGLAIALQVGLPRRFSIHPFWLLPALEAGLMVGLTIVNPMQIGRTSNALRAASIVLIGVISLGNAWSAAYLVRELIDGRGGANAGTLLATGGSIWVTNVIVFALWYWELDRGGPAARATAPRPYPDLLFPQMSSPELAPPGWEPKFWDYLYLSFTNATAFSPTDVMPLARWAKMTMLAQSAVSLATVALVIARAVNILR